MCLLPDVPLVCLALSLTLLHNCLSAAPTVVQITNAASIRPGEQFSFHCSLEGGSMVSYTMFWYRQVGTSLEWVCNEHGSCDEPFKLRFATKLEAAQNRFTLQLSSCEETDSATYFCAASPDRDYDEAYFGDGTKLVVLEHDVKPPTVVVLQPASKEIADHQTATLVCVISDFYPDNIKIRWWLNGQEIPAKDARIYTDPEALRTNGNKTFSVSSRLRLDARDWVKSRSAMCQVDHYQKGDKPTPYNHTIQVKEVLCGISKEEKIQSIGSGRMTYLILICKSVLYGIIASAIVLKTKKSYSKRFD